MNFGFKSRIKNKAQFEVTTCGKKHLIESNDVYAEKIKLRVRKEQSCDCVFPGDEIKYTIKVYNDSFVDLCDVEFKDLLQEDICYESNSFKVNGHKVEPTMVGHMLCYVIPKIKDHEEVIITFDAKVE